MGGTTGNNQPEVQNKTVYYVRKGSKTDESWVMAYEKDADTATPDPQVIVEAVRKVSPYVEGLLETEKVAKELERYEKKKDKKRREAYLGVLQTLVKNDIVRIYNVISYESLKDLANPEKLIPYDPNDTLPTIQSPFGQEDNKIQKTMQKLRMRSKDTQAMEAIRSESGAETWKIIGGTAAALGGVALGAISLAAAIGSGGTLSAPAVAGLIFAGTLFAAGLSLYASFADSRKAFKELSGIQEDMFFDIKSFTEMYDLRAHKLPKKWRKEGEEYWGEKVKRKGGRKGLKIDRPAIKKRENEIMTLMPEVFEKGLEAHGVEDRDVHAQQGDGASLYRIYKDLGVILFGQPNALFLAYDVLKDKHDELPGEAVDALNEYVDQSYWRMVPCTDAGYLWADILAVNRGDFLADIGDEPIAQLKEGMALDDPWISELQSIVWNMGRGGIKLSDAKIRLVREQNAQERQREAEDLRRRQEQFMEPDATSVHINKAIGTLDFREAPMEDESLRTLASGQIAGDGQALPYIQELAGEEVAGIDLSAMQVSYSPESAVPPPPAGREPVRGTAAGTAAGVPPAPSGATAGGPQPPAPAPTPSAPLPAPQLGDLTAGLTAPLISETQLATTPDTERYFETPAEATGGAYTPVSYSPGGGGFAGGGAGGARGYGEAEPRIVYNFQPEAIVIKKQDINEEQVGKMVLSFLKSYSNQGSSK